MDGYAVVAADTLRRGHATRAKVAAARRDACSPARSPRAASRAGECIEIATGAPMPAGADAVVMVEETERTTAMRSACSTPVYPRQNVGRRAADIAAGQVVLRAGEVLNSEPRRRAGGHRHSGRRGLRAAVRSRFCRPATKSSSPASRSAPGQIYDINRFTLGAIVRRHGGMSVALPICRRHASTDLSAALDAALVPTSSCSPAAARSANAI